MSKAVDKLNIFPFLFVHAVSHLLPFQLETICFVSQNKTTATKQTALQMLRIP